jgi:hypothetical protein
MRLLARPLLPHRTILSKIALCFSFQNRMPVRFEPSVEQGITRSIIYDLSFFSRDCFDIRPLPAVYTHIPMADYITNMRHNSANLSFFR